MSSSPSTSRSATPEPQMPDKKLKRKRAALVEKVVEKAEETEDDTNSDGEEEEEEANQEPEDPVLSHAERRRQKKAAKLAAEEKEREGSASKKRKLKDGTAKDVESSSASKRQHSVWVGNMSFKTQQENLRSFFKDVGEITRVNMPTKPPAGPGVKPENRGFAYVDFASAEAKTAAIAFSEQPLLGRKLLIKDGDDFAGRPAAIVGEHTINDPALAHKTHSKTAQKILRVQKQPPGPTLFFGNLGFETTDASIRELLEAHRSGNKTGKDTAEEAEQKSKDVWIRKVRMGTFEDTGACKGFAFVDFMTIDHATSALINPKNHHLNGRDLVVEYASPDAVRRGAPKGKGGGDGVFKGSRSFRTDRPKWDSERPPRQSVAQTHDDAEKPASASASPTKETPKKSWEQKERSNIEGSRHKGPKTRPKPGAALALAKRESTAIVPSEGRKITF